MADVLSQSELESLLVGLGPGGCGESSSSGCAPQARSSDGWAGGNRAHDINRAEVLCTEQLQALHALYDGVAQEFSEALGDMLRTTVDVKLTGVDQLTYGEFVSRLEDPTCFNLLQAEGLDGQWILELSPSIVFPIVDRMLGGGLRHGRNFPDRPFTEIELRLASRIVNLAISGLESAWSNIVALKLRVSQVESNPQREPIVPADETAVSIGFEIALGEARGTMHLCVPFHTIEPFVDKLSSDAWSAHSKRADDRRQSPDLATGVSGSTAMLTVHLADAKLTAGEFSNLEIGDVIVTQKHHHEGVEISIDGRPTYSGSPGLLNGHKAVQLGRRIERRDDAAADA